MSFANIQYKSFCWSLGTTSFRTKNFNLIIEKQLDLLQEFWNLSENAAEQWSGNNTLQSRYYDFMKINSFVKGDAGNKPKDAREKTSGLVDIGLISEERKLTKVGLALLEISKSNDFKSDNELQIPKDSYIYLKQLLKTHCEIDSDAVRPFVVLLYALSNLNTLTLDEFTYLLPLCTTKEVTNTMIVKIKESRTRNVKIDEIIIETLLDMDNYRSALSLFQENAVTEDLICTIGFNRKSRDYDKSYYPLYIALKEVFINKNSDYIEKIYEATQKVNIGKHWRNYLFDTSSVKAIIKSPIEHLNTTEFSKVVNEFELKDVFFKKMHLFKAKATLSDYLDLNRRYIKTTDVILFEDDTIKLDIVPKQFFNSIADKLFTEAFDACDKLYDNCAMSEIAPYLVINEPAIIAGINSELGTTVSTMDEARKVVEDERYSRLQHLIDTKFTDENLIKLLEMFELRSDSEINAMVTDNADIPTIFEYVLGIIWYKASNRQGKILDYMKLSLEVDLLPKTHAGGGEADIVYEYSATDFYPEHTLLLEATLANANNQRNMEMEPVSRHLGRHLLRNGNSNSYCVFATNFLNINVISDFRGRKTMPFYDTRDYSKSVDGMKIIPLQTSELKTIIKNEIKYEKIYKIFEEAFNSELLPHTWYDTCILPMIWFIVLCH